VGGLRERPSTGKRVKPLMDAARAYLFGGAYRPLHRTGNTQKWRGGGKRSASECKMVADDGAGRRGRLMVMTADINFRQEPQTVAFRLA